MPIYINPDISREQQRICNCDNIYVQKTKKYNTFADINNSHVFAEYKSGFEKRLSLFVSIFLNTCYSLICFSDGKIIFYDFSREMHL